MAVQKNGSCGGVFLAMVQPNRVRTYSIELGQSRPAHAHQAVGGPTNEVPALASYSRECLTSDGDASNAN